MSSVHRNAHTIEIISLRFQITAMTETIFFVAKWILRISTIFAGIFPHINCGNSCIVKIDHLALRTLTVLTPEYVFFLFSPKFVWICTFFKCIYFMEADQFIIVIKKICHLRFAVSQSLPKLLRITVHIIRMSGPSRNDFPSTFDSFAHCQSKYLLTWQLFFCSHLENKVEYGKKWNVPRIYGPNSLA